MNIQHMVSFMKKLFGKMISRKIVDFCPFFQQIHELQDELRKLYEDNRELNRRVSELTKIKTNLKEKNFQLEKQQEILLKNTNGKKVGEIIGYVDKQRAVYRDNIKQLLNKLDPKGRALEEFEKYDQEVEISPDGPSTKINLPPKFHQNENIPPKVKNLRKDEQNYVPSAYKSNTGSEFLTDDEINVLKREKHDLEAKFLVKKQELMSKIATLEEEILTKNHEIAEAKKVTRQTVSTFHKNYVKLIFSHIVIHYAPETFKMES